MSDEDREREKDFMKNYYYERKKMLIYLINVLKNYKTLFLINEFLNIKKVFWVLKSNYIKILWFF